ncbi:MAG: GDP-mannose 4,6-dehydratase [Alphaproteobacteria bacterium]|nr:GDP-mannose 4,6-dehydratase [Alphaproteobacteria bacterium]
MGRTALIFGISGQDGAYLARLLLEAGRVVHGTSRDHEASSFRNLAQLGIRERVHLHSAALNDFRSVIRVLDRVGPDEIYNLAGQTSVGLSFDMPVETFESISVGTLNILECIRFLKRPIRLFNAASSECFGNTDRPADEDTPFHPRSPYAAAKAAAYWTVRNYREAYGMYACSGILFNHESPLRLGRFVTRKIVATAARIARGGTERLTLGDLSIARDWGWAPEFAEAIRLMLEQDEPRDLVIATGRTIRLEEFVALAFGRLGLDWRDHVDVDPTLFRPSEIQRSMADPSRAARILGWRARTPVDGVVANLVDQEMGRERNEPT